MERKVDVSSTREENHAIKGDDLWHPGFNYQPNVQLTVISMRPSGWPPADMSKKTTAET